MKSLYNYIISTTNRYDNKVSIDNKELILNTEVTERDYMFVNRIGTVVNVPINITTHIKPGDDNQGMMLLYIIMCLEDGLT